MICYSESDAKTKPRRNSGRQEFVAIYVGVPMPLAEQIVATRSTSWDLCLQRGNRLRYLRGNQPRFR